MVENVIFNFTILLLYNIKFWIRQNCHTSTGSGSGKKVSLQPCPDPQNLFFYFQEGLCNYQRNFNIIFKKASLKTTLKHICICTFVYTAGGEAEKIKNQWENTKKQRKITETIRKKYQKNKGKIPEKQLLIGRHDCILYNWPLISEILIWIDIFIM